MYFRKGKPQIRLKIVLLVYNWWADYKYYNEIDRQMAAWEGKASKLTYFP